MMETLSDVFRQQRVRWRKSEKVSSVGINSIFFREKCSVALIGGPLSRSMVHLPVDLLSMGLELSLELSPWHQFELFQLAAMLPRIFC